MLGLIACTKYLSTTKDLLNPTKTTAGGRGPAHDLDHDGLGPPILCGRGEVVAGLKAMSDWSIRLLPFGAVYNIRDSFRDVALCVYNVYKELKGQRTRCTKRDYFILSTPLGS